MTFGNIIREKGGVVLPKGLSLSEDIGSNGFAVVSVVSSGSLVAHNDKLLGEVYSYGIQNINTKPKTQKKQKRIIK